MSQRTAEANKAISIAWKNEQQLIREDKGTRDWTPEQQQDILTRGKAYDENGKAFEGQHMRSAELYPECQGDPNNIQFLTRAEHLEAHDGAWSNPTNWYFDPVTKEKIDFGDGPIIPCEVISLTNPIVVKENEHEPKPKSEKRIAEPEEKKNSGVDPPKSENEATSNQSKHSKPIFSKESGQQMNDASGFLKKVGTGIAKGAKAAAKFVVNHKGEVVLVLTSIVTGIAEAVINSNGSGYESGDSISNDSHPYVPSPSRDKINTGGLVNNERSFTERNYPETHASPREHDVSGYTRHWNGKEIHVDPYKRGGKNADE